MITKSSVILLSGLTNIEFTPLDIPQNPLSKTVSYDEFCKPPETNPDTLKYNVISIEYINKTQNDAIIDDILIKSMQDSYFLNKP